jgi:hypothetical protein
VAVGRRQGPETVAVVGESPLLFVASLVSNFVAFVESAVIFSQRHRGAENMNREWTRIDGVFLTAKNAKSAKGEPRMDANTRECTHIWIKRVE